jgi:GNAT superfamily N-acetyltransferase
MTATLSLRQATVADVGALFGLVSAMNLADIGDPDCTSQDILDDLARPTFHAWLHEAGDGHVDGAVWIGTFPGAPLLDVARQRVHELDPALPLHVFSQTASVGRIAALEAAGGTVVRRFLRMVAPVSDGVAAAQLPTGAAIRLIDADDPAELRTMYDVLETAFADHFGAVPASYDEWLEFRSSVGLSDRTLWWLATVDGQPAAALIGRRWLELGWIEEVGTLPAYRGRGLARALLLTAFEELRRRGFAEVGLGVDATNPTGAVGLYESIGMTLSREMACYEFWS